MKYISIFRLSININIQRWIMDKDSYKYIIFCYNNYIIDFYKHMQNNE